MSNPISSPVKGQCSDFAWPLNHTLSYLATVSILRAWHTLARLFFLDW